MVSLSNHSGGIWEFHPFDRLRACPVLDTGVSGEEIFSVVKTPSGKQFDIISMEE